MAKQVALIGNDQVKKAFESFSDSVRRRAIVRAVRGASKPVLTSMKGKVPQDYGVLKKSLGTVVRKYPRGRSPYRVVSFVGPRKGEYYVGYAAEPGAIQTYQRNTRRPTKYAHLVEYGTAPHWISPKGQRGAVGTLRIGQNIISGAVLHLGARAQPFMRPSWDSSRSGARSTLRKEIAAAVKREARKAATKAPKRT